MLGRFVRLFSVVHLSRDAAEALKDTAAKLSSSQEVTREDNGEMVLPQLSETVTAISGSDEEERRKCRNKLPSITYVGLN